jgi:quercetin dioxygenase-like cupin family protein
MSHVLVENVAESVTIPAKGIVSQTVHSDAHVKVVMFGFDAGQELSEHTASMPAVMHFLKGSAQVTLGPERLRVQAGTWIHMPPWLPHSIQAETPLVMLLTLIKGGKVDQAAAGAS